MDIDIPYISFSSNKIDQGYEFLNHAVNLMVSCFYFYYSKICYPRAPEYRQAAIFIVSCAEYKYLLYECKVT